MFKMDDFYVNIDNPSEKRRVLLQSSRDLITSLKVLDDFLESKKEKKALLDKVHSVFKELARLNNKLKAKLPKAPSAKDEFKMPSIPAVPYAEVKVAKTKLDVLEDELAAIEEKLSKLE